MSFTALSSGTRRAFHARSSRQFRRPPVMPMPTRVFLVCHASHDHDTMLVGRMPGTGLTEDGIRESRRLARKLARHGIARVQSSPRQRALETARIIAKAAKVPIDITFCLDDVDFGAWTGMSLTDLAKDPGWQRWTMMRSLACSPDGECARDVQSRVMRQFGRVHAANPGGSVAFVTHPEVIRMAAAHCHGISLDRCDEIDVPLASVTMVSVVRSGSELVTTAESL